MPNLFQAMDCFVLPSRFEGLGIVGIEAQASDLPCFFSDVVPREVDVIGKSVFVSLRSISSWVSNILAVDKSNSRYDTKPLMVEAGYEIDSEIKRLEAFYETKLMTSVL